MFRRTTAALLLCLFLPSLSFVSAHPVPRRAHDRTIVLRLAADEKTGQVAVTVNYRLEVDEFTVVFDDLPALFDKAELSKLQTREEFHEAFTRLYAPLLGANLTARLDGQPLDFTCVHKSYRLTDENGAPLNHLRCDFVFESRARTLPCRGIWPRPGIPAPFVAGDLLLADLHTFSFREGNYELEEGLIRASFASDLPLKYLSKTEPGAPLQMLPAADLKPGDDARLRTLRAAFVLSRKLSTSSESLAARPITESKQQEQLAPKGGLTWLQELSLRDLFREIRYGFWMLMLLSLAVGGIHAMTPGHGKTLVAAYLVGERGTVGHAILLGLVTTLTHTGVVLAVAIALRLFVPDGRLSAAGQQSLHTALELGGGLLVVGLGFWLLLRRLAGQADHVHLPGHGHYHHHGHHDHTHDEPGHVHALPEAQPVNVWGLIVLGINGGIVPCWDAIVVLLLAVSTNRLWLALPMLLAFSAGLAAVLILVGIIVVRAKHLADPRWNGSRLSKLLPIMSALVVTLLGLWLCYDSFHVKPEQPVDVAQIR
jgi:nickel/cobalt exporter